MFKYFLLTVVVVAINGAIAYLAFDLAGILGAIVLSGIALTLSHFIFQGAAKEWVGK